VETYPDGAVRKLLIFEDGLPHLREVPARFVKSFGGDVQLKGPREGFHITRLGHVGPPLPPPSLLGPDPSPFIENPAAAPGSVRETL